MYSESEDKRVPPIVKRKSVQLQSFNRDVSNIKIEKLKQAGLFAHLKNSKSIDSEEDLPNNHNSDPSRLPRLKSSPRQSLFDRFTSKSQLTKKQEIHLKREAYGSNTTRKTP